MVRWGRSAYPCTQTVNIAGKKRVLAAVPVGGVMVVVKGRLLKVAEIHDEFWLESRILPHPEEVLRVLEVLRLSPDLFTFAQKLPDVIPRYPYRIEWDNVAAVPITSYEHWMNNQVAKKTKYSITKAYRKGVVTRVVRFDDELVDGIYSIYNELPVRQGKPFWHYGKPKEVVKQDTAAFLERARFIGAYYGEELVGFTKLVIDGQVASILHCLSKRKHSDKSPTNALLAKAVEFCEGEGLHYLTYDKYIYGNKTNSSLTAFKRHNGFIPINVPRYFVPLSLRGRIALKCNLHLGLSALIPPSIRARLIALRAWYYRHRTMSSCD